MEIGKSVCMCEGIPPDHLPIEPFWPELRAYLFISKLHQRMSVSLSKTYYEKDDFTLVYGNNLNVGQDTVCFCRHVPDIATDEKGCLRRNKKKKVFIKFACLSGFATCSSTSQ